MSDWLTSAGAAWLAAAAVLALAELAAPGVFLVFLAAAAALTGAALFFLPDLPLAAQLGAFGAWSVVAVLVGRRWYRDYPVASSDPLLNDRAARLVGTIVTLEGRMADGRGRAILGDGSWPATGPDTPAGTRMRVVAVEDGVLRLAPLAPPS